ncbi:MAG: 4-hydroxy-tetrahydrodipicolinate reductase [Cyclobacteriaceae bacterium]
MNILIIGYGQMGQSIEAYAVDKGHIIVAKIDQPEEWKEINSDEVDVAIEFTQPDAAFANITQCFEHGIPVISGTTGWLDKYDQAIDLCNEKAGTFLYASNFSLGVNIFFKLNEWLAKVMAKQTAYKPSIEEIHHTRKKDKPSGTAISLAEGIIGSSKCYTGWSFDENGDNIQMESKREGDVPGTHFVRYNSSVDNIEIKHEAFSREGFVAGAVAVAEWIRNKKGVYTMDDFLGL